MINEKNHTCTHLYYKSSKPETYSGKRMKKKNHTRAHKTSSLRKSWSSHEEVEIV